MGCRLSGQWTDQKKGGKGREKSRRHRKEFHFLDEYGQPVTVQVEGRKGRRHHQCYTTDCSTQTERHWEALRRLGVVEGSEPALGGYAQGPYYDPRTLPPDLYSANGFLPSVSYGVDEIDSLDYQDSDMLSYQPNNRSCLIGCCNTDQEDPSSLLSQGEYESGWLEPPLGYLPLHERDSGLGCTDGSIHQGELSEPESEEGPEEAVSSPPGHTSRGSSSSSESLLSSELSDSGFHSISTGEFRRFQKILDGRMHSRRTRHLPRDQWPGSKARWDLESIPESRASEQTPASHQCTMGNSGQIRNARSPSLGRRQAGPSLAASCRTEPCQRRAFRLNQHTSMELPGRSYTMQDLSDKRRASHPALPLEHQGYSRQAREERRGPLGTQGSQGEAAWQGEYRQERRAAEAGARQQYITTTCQRQSSDSQGPTNRPASGSGSGCGSGGTPDWRGVQTLAPLTPQPDPACGPLYNTLGGGSPRTRTPRTARNQLLKARASRLADERSEVTTDEEARGEGWAGRYWNRTERRRHLAVARQQRQRKAARGGAEGVSKEGGGGGLETSCGGVSSGAGCRSVLELSHRKQSRLRNHKLLDDWTTVEELLTHGTRLGLDQTLCPSPLLSVTTV